MASSGGAGAPKSKLCLLQLSSPRPAPPASLARPGAPFQQHLQAPGLRFEPARCHKAPPSVSALPADNTRRYGHPFAGGPGPIGPGDWPELCIAPGAFRATMGQRTGVSALRSPGGGAARRDFGRGTSGLLFSYSLRINHPFWVCAPAFLGSTIDPESSRAPLIPPPRNGVTAFLTPARSYAIGNASNFRESAFIRNTNVAICRALRLSVAYPARLQPRGGYQAVLRQGSKRRIGSAVTAPHPRSAAPCALPRSAPPRARRGRSLLQAQMQHGVLCPREPVAGVGLKRGQLPGQPREVAGRVPGHVVGLLRSHISTNRTSYAATAAVWPPETPRGGPGRAQVPRGCCRASINTRMSCSTPSSALSMCSSTRRVRMAWPSG
jgi:hypothetical protein